MENDHEYTDHVIDGVERGGDGWEIRLDRLTCFFIPDKGIEPKVGSTLRLYGKGFGWRVRGAVVDGRTVFYRTAAEEDEDHRRQVEESQRKRREDFEANRTGYEARIDALPAAFRHRIAIRRKNNPDFAWEYGGYELMCCEQAVLIAETLETPGAIDAFAALDWEERKRRVPGLYEGHSGNTFAASCGLAKLYLSDPVSVPAAMGAMAPVVGSVAYGDVSPEEATSMEASRG